MIIELIWRYDTGKLTVCSFVPAWPLEDSLKFIRNPIFGEKMKNCSKCKQAIQNGDEKNLHNKIVCEDCYIDEVMPKMPKAHYDNDAEFMQRLQDSYSVRKQQYHWFSLT